MGNEAFQITNCVLERYLGNESYVVVPNSVKFIEMSGFAVYENLKEIYISSLESWNKIDFNGHYSNPLCFGAKLYLNGEHVEDL